MEKITILLVDDHPIVLCGLRYKFQAAGDFHVVAAAGSTEEAVVRAQEHRPDVALIDICLAGSNGIEACRLVRACSPSTAVVTFTAYDYDAYLAEAYAAGAAAFVVKHTDPTALIESARASARGEKAFTPAQLQRISRWQEEVQAHLDRLTERERTVCCP